MINELSEEEYEVEKKQNIIYCMCIFLRRNHNE